MSGNQTHGYDLAIEFSEHFFNQFLGVTLDSPTTGGGSGNLLCQLLTAMGQGSLCGAFTVDVLMDRPAASDVAIPASATDFLDIRIGIASGGVQLRFVVGLITDRSQPNADIFMLDFEGHLFAAKASIGGWSIPDALVMTAAQNVLKKIPLPSIPLPNGRGSINPGDIIQADTRVINDTSGADRDAWALLLTFGGGTPGSSSAFTESFIPTGGNGAIGIYFHWLMRILSPMLGNALGMGPTAIVDGHFAGNFEINHDEDVKLTNLDLSLEGDGLIHVSARVTKSGFCYEASGTVSATLDLRIEGGHLIVVSHVNDPDINVDIPWYCWLAGAVIGAIIGGALFGIIGAIVGAVLVPLITWIASEVIEGTIENVTSTIADAINNLIPDVNIAIPGITFVLDDVFIDDIVVKATATVKDCASVKCSGNVVLYNGQFLDLDTGTVRLDDSSGADIQLIGSSFSRALRNVCRSALARTNQRVFSTLPRFTCYGYTYQHNAVVPLNELASFDVLGMLWGDKFDEERMVYAVITNENRYSLFRVVQVEDTWMRVEYKTFGVAQSLSILGDFACDTMWEPIESVDIVFTPTAILAQNAQTINTLWNSSTKSVNAYASGNQSLSYSMERALDYVNKVAVEQDNNATYPRGAISVASSAEAPSVLAHTDVSIDTHIGHLGTWMGNFAAKKKDTGNFYAKAEGLTAPVNFFWAINGDKLEDATGTLNIDGKRVNYVVNAQRLTLTPIDRLTFEFELKVTAVDNSLTSLTKIRCIKYVPICKTTKRVIPRFNLYQKHYQKLWGRAEVPVRSIKKSPLALSHR